MSKRLIVSLIAGSILGVFCVVGAQLRYDGVLESSYIFSFWYNRVLMGLLIGLLPQTTKYRILIIRGVFFGLIVSFAFYSATGFYDLTGFLVGGLYGVIIEYTAYKLSNK